MLKEFLFVTFLSFIACFSSQYDYQLSISNRHESITCVNGIRSSCDCGKSPVLVMILYGQLQLYCEEHMPIVEEVRRITPENLIETLRRD